jgi:regulator of sigma E protease
MGPAMNLLLAFVVTAIILYQGVDAFSYEDQAPIVGVVTAGSPAERAGIQKGDRITAVAGRSVETWEQFYMEVSSRSNREIAIDVNREGAQLQKQVTPVNLSGQRFEIGDIGVQPDVHPHLMSINPGEPGDKAGLKAGDIVLAVNGETITFSGQLRQAIEKHPEQTITISILRNESPMSVTATPMRNGKVGRLGVAIADDTKSIKPGFVEAIRLSFVRNVQMSAMIGKTVWGLLTREVSRNQLIGPIGIAQLSGESAQLGWIPLFTLMASLSLNLGLINLLPIPVLDGGHIFIMAMEGLTRHDFSVRMKEKMLLAGLLVLVTLMVTVIYNDLARISWIEKLMPWR